MTDALRIDPVWENKYAAGHSQRYPWDIVVSFIFRNAPKDRRRRDVRILEVGCGTGSNLWFAAREGFNVSGIDASPSAVAIAKRRFQEEGLDGDLRVGDFAALPFANDIFDLVVDRASITCVGHGAAHSAFAEISRVLAPGGRFLFNPYSDRHSSRTSGRPGRDGLTVDIRSGTLAGAGQICFYERLQVETALKRFRLLSLRHVEIAELLDPDMGTHAEWRAVAERAA